MRLQEILHGNVSTHDVGLLLISSQIFNRLTNEILLWFDVVDDIQKVSTLPKVN